MKKQKTEWRVDSNGDVLDEQSLLIARPQHPKNSPLIAAAPKMRELLKEISLHLYTAQDADRYRVMAREAVARL